MTADRRAPDSDALALVLSDHAGFYGDPWPSHRAQAAAVLAAIESDPDVQAAALAALTRGGALTEEAGVRVARHIEVVDKWTERQWLSKETEADRRRVRRRLVTPWREVE